MWSFATSGKKVTVTGTGSEMINSNHTWDATVNAKGKAGKKITALVNTDTGTVFKWSGKPDESHADLSGHWTGQVSTKNSITAADYVLVKSSEEPELFEIRESSGAVPSGIVVGEAIVTSKNKLVVHVKQDGRNSVLTGRYAPTKRRMTLSGHDEIGQPISITVN
jgi:Txe/YoeB family toxin of Txe-Axe toxin-antitoxin module